MSKYLEKISAPSDLAKLSFSELAELSLEIRDFLIEKVSKSGGHLGPNLGVVELTIAIHRIFESPKDTIIFDTGHQSYVHKLLTGRIAGFDKLRQRGGVSGYPNRAESEHDVGAHCYAAGVVNGAEGGDCRDEGVRRAEVQRTVVADACVVIACQIPDHARGQLDVVGAVGQKVQRGVDGDSAAADVDLRIAHRDGAGVGAIADDDIARAGLHGLAEGQHNVAAHQHSAALVSRRARSQRRGDGV